MRQKDSKKPSVYLERPPRRSVVSLISQNKDPNSNMDTTAVSAKGEMSPDSPEMLKYKAKKNK
jgi:hypothetical protein